MIGEANVFGVYLPWLLVLATLGLFVTWGLRRLLAAAGAYRWVWHPALFDIALYVLVLLALSSASRFLQ